MQSRAATPFDQAHAPACRATTEAGVTRVVVSGEWTLRLLGRIRICLNELGEVEPRGRPVEIDLSQLQALDTAGALALVNMRNRIDGKAAAFINERREYRILLDEVARAAPAT